MPNWSETSTVYKVGTFGVFFSFLFFLVGFATIAWSENSYGRFGLWQACYTKTDICLSQGFGVSGLSDGFRIGEIVTLLFLVFGVIMAIVVNTCSPQKSPYLVSRTIIIGGILGCTHDVIFIYISGTVHLSWSYALNTIGSVLALISGIAVAVSRRSHRGFDSVIQRATEPQVYYTNLEQRTTPGYALYSTAVPQMTYTQATTPPIGEHVEQTGTVTAPQASNYVQPPAYQQHGV